MKCAMMQRGMLLCSERWKNVETLFKVATYVASYEPRSISYRPRQPRGPERLT